MNHFNLTITSETGNLGKVENFIEYIIEEFEIPEKLRARIALPVIEAVTNSILFRNENDPRKSVKLYAVKGSRKIVITVEDEGKGIDFEKLPNFTTMNKLMEETGRGMYLMVSLPDELLFSRNGAKVIMTYYLNNPIYSQGLSSF